MSESEVARVLVIDDQKDVARMISMVLVRAGCLVELAASADEAASVFASTPGFDLVICDVMLPGTSGPATVERLGHPFPATIFVSGYPRTHFVGTSEEIPSAASFVRKPFRSAEFVTSVRDLLTTLAD